jgi:sulfatase maturation enzyme AslB (radical SAM superfamily)
MIHGGLSLSFSDNEEIGFGHCCLISGRHTTSDLSNVWDDEHLRPMRELNKQNKWSERCNCQYLEKSGIKSMRMGMNEGLGISQGYDLKGPYRIDIKFDRQCNLACRICGPHSSTYWQKHLRDNSLPDGGFGNRRNKDRVLDTLQNIDLSNLRQFVFSGGETLMGNDYWEISEWLVNTVKNSKDQLMLSFQTNGTQPIPEKFFHIIEKTNLVKINVSLDGVGDRFEYMRWPSNWNQVTDNLFSLKERLPSNVMFLIEETISIFNLAYLNELESWSRNHFFENREGDVINHTRHLAGGIFGLNNVTKEYVGSLRNTEYAHLIPSKWQENSDEITKMILEIKKFDNLRGESFEKTFPIVASYYSRFL